MAIAGTLEIQLLANLARLQSDMTQAKGMVGSAMADISSAVASAKSALASLGISIGVGAFAMLIKSSIDAADHLNDLSKSTGIAAETLSGLRLAAKQTGSELDGTAAAINKLSQNIGKDSEKFRALGITAKEPLEAFKQLADIYVRLEDPQQRAAVAAATLGKSWAAAAPMLAEGGAQIQAMVDKGAALSGVTNQMAKDADAFNDKLAELVGNGGLVNSMVREMLPLLNAALDGLLLFRGGTDKASEGLSPLAEVLRVIIVLFGNVGFVLNGIGTTMGGVLAAQMAVMTGNFGKAVDIIRQMNQDADAARVSFDKWVASIMAVGSSAKAATPVLDASDQVSRRLASNTAAAARAFLSKGDAVVKATKAVKELDDGMKALLASEIAFLKAMEQLTNIAKDYEASLREQIAQQEFEVSLIGKTADEVRRLTEMRKLDLDLARQIEKIYALVEGDIGAAQQAEIAKLIELNDLAKVRIGLILDTGVATKATISDLAAQAKVWDDMAAAAGNFFGDLVVNGKSAFDNLKKMLKSLLQEMIALFAKRWILNMAAGGSVGDSALSAASGGPGSSLLSSGLSLAGNYGASALGFTGGLGTVAQFAGAFSGAIPAGAIGSGAVAAGVGVDTAAAGMGAWAGALGATGWGLIIVAAVAAIAAIADRVRDHENWQATLGFGANAQAYTTQGPFGAEGFQSIQGSDDLNRLIQQFMASTGAIDTIIAGTLSAATIATITANLGGAYTTRNDGQPAQFAFGADDQTAGQQLTLEYLQKKYGTIFDEIDASYADFIRHFTGTSEELLVQIAHEADFLNSISAMGSALGIRGLNLDSLQAMQLQGETLQQTLSRVATSWTQFNDAFMSDAQKLEAARAFVISTFDTLGVAIPDSTAAFYDLVHGLDLGTESGRHMFEALMQVAPAFQTVSAAAANAVADFHALAAQLGGGSGAGGARSVLEAAVNSWRSLNPQNMERSLEQVIADIASGMGTGDAALAYAQRLGGNAVEVLNAMLRAYAAWQSAMAAANVGVSSGSTGVTSSFDAAAAAAASLALALANARMGLRDYLDGLLLDSHLSPLDPMQQLTQARTQYEAMLAAARAGDPNSISGLQGAADAYLRIARDLFASSNAYQDIFQRVFDSLAGVANVPGLNERLTAAGEKTATVIVDVVALLIQIRDNDMLLSDRVVTSVEDGADRVVSAVDRNTSQLGAR